jgi:hypothetical protein
MDKEINCQLYEAFHLGVRAALALEGKQVTNQQLKQLKKQLGEFAAGLFTLHEPGREAMDQPEISEIIAMKHDKKLAGQILQFWK